MLALLSGGGRRHKTVVQSFIAHRLDWCNALLYGVPENLLRKVQSVQNAAARLLTNTRRRDHITPSRVILGGSVTNLSEPFFLDGFSILDHFEGKLAPMYLPKMTANFSTA